MCFSASASFTASGGLAIIGTLSLFIAPKRLKLLACTPLVFSLQQAIEGLIWIFHNTRPSIATSASYAFCIIALIWWPLWFSSVFLYRGEKNRVRKTGLWITFCTGLFLSAFNTWFLISKGIHPEMSAHIIYGINPPILQFFNYLFYPISTIGPFLLTSERFMWILAIVFSLTYIVTSKWFPFHITSVWCFFSAVASSAILSLVVIANRKSH